MLLTLVFPLLLLGGAVIAAQSSINGALGARVDVLTSAWLTFVIGAVVTFLLVIFFEPPHEATLFTVPKWQLLGALFGIYCMTTIVFAVPRIGTAATNVAIIAGQMFMGLLIDHFAWFGNAHLPLDYTRLAAIALLAAALYMIYLSNTRRQHLPANA